MQTAFVFTECRILTPIFACVRGYLMENDHATGAVPGACRYSLRSALEALVPVRVVAHDYAGSKPQVKVWPTSRLPSVGPAGAGPTECLPRHHSAPVTVESLACHMNLAVKLNLASLELGPVSHRSRAAALPWESAPTRPPSYGHDRRTSEAEQPDPPQDVL